MVIAKLLTHRNTTRRPSYCTLCIARHNTASSSNPKKYPKLFICKQVQKRHATVVFLKAQYPHCGRLSSHTNVRVVFVRWRGRVSDVHYYNKCVVWLRSAVVKSYNTQSLVLTRLPTPDEFCVRTDAKETVTNNALWRKCNKTPVYSISVRVTCLYDQSF